MREEVAEWCEQYGLEKRHSGRWEAPDRDSAVEMDGENHLLVLKDGRMVLRGDFVEIDEHLYVKGERFYEAHDNSEGLFAVYANEYGRFFIDGPVPEQ